MVTWSSQITAPDSISEQLVVNIFLGGSNTNADETTIQATLHVGLANRLPNTKADETTIHTLLHTCFVYALCVLVKPHNNALSVFDIQSEQKATLNIFL